MTTGGAYFLWVLGLIIIVFSQGGNLASSKFVSVFVFGRATYQDEVQIYPDHPAGPEPIQPPELDTDGTRVGAPLPCHRDVDGGVAVAPPCLQLLPRPRADPTAGGGGGGGGDARRRQGLQGDGFLSRPRQKLYVVCCQFVMQYSSIRHFYLTHKSRRNII